MDLNQEQTNTLTRIRIADRQGNAFIVKETTAGPVWREHSKRKGIWQMVLQSRSVMPSQVNALVEEGYLIRVPDGGHTILKPTDKR